MSSNIDQLQNSVESSQAPSTAIAVEENLQQSAQAANDGEMLEEVTQIVPNEPTSIAAATATETASAATTATETATSTAPTTETTAGVNEQISSSSSQLQLNQNISRYSKRCNQDGPQLRPHAEWSSQKFQQKKPRMQKKTAPSQTDYEQAVETSETVEAKLQKKKHEQQTWTYQDKTLTKEDIKRCFEDKQIFNQANVFTRKSLDDLFEDSDEDIQQDGLVTQIHKRNMQDVYDMAHLDKKFTFLWNEFFSLIEKEKLKEKTPIKRCDIYTFVQQFVSLHALDLLPLYTQFVIHLFTLQDNGILSSTQITKTLKFLKSIPENTAVHQLDHLLVIQQSQEKQQQQQRRSEEANHSKVQ